LSSRRCFRLTGRSCKRISGEHAARTATRPTEATPAPQPPKKSGHPPSHGARGSSRVTAVTPFDLRFSNSEYLEKSPVLVRAPAAGRHYQFSSAHPVRPIAARDADVRLRTVFFRWVQGSLPRQDVGLVGLASWRARGRFDMATGRPI
jgi:hypothetical protein